MELAKLEQEITKSKEKKIKIFPVNANRASQIGHPCLRYLVFERTRWSDKLKHDVGLQYIFDEGNEHEKIVIKTLVEAGFEVKEQQRAFKEERENVTGHIDLIFAHPNHVDILGDGLPGEIKSMSQFNYNSVNKYDDMVKHKYHYMRSYPAQMQIYLFQTEYEEGLFILKNKSSGRIKFVHVKIDYDYVDSLLEKAKKINYLVSEKTPPEDIESTDDISICEGCSYRHICFADKDFGEGIKIFDEEEAKKLLEELMSKEEVVKEYNEIKKRVSEIFKAKFHTEKGPKAQYATGNYIVELVRQKQNRVIVPDEMKDQFRQEVEIVKLNKIIKI